MKEKEALMPIETLFGELENHTVFTYSGAPPGDRLLCKTSPQMSHEMIRYKGQHQAVGTKKPVNPKARVVRLSQREVRRHLALYPESS